MDKSEAERILDYLKRIDESINGPQHKDRPRTDQRPLVDRMDSISERVDSVSDRVDTVSDRVDSVSGRMDSISDRVDSVSDRVDNLDKKIGTSRSNRPLAEQVDKLDDRMSEVQLGLATLTADTKEQSERVDDRFDQTDRQFERADKRFDAIDVKFKHVDKRFDHVDQTIESARVEIVDLVTRVHHEVTERIIDLEDTGPGRRGGGGSGSGNGGVPLAS